MLHLAAKAFWPAPIPFPVLHVDTGHNFPEVLAYRDATVERLGCASRSPRCRTGSTTAGCASGRRHPQPAADPAAARRHRAAPLRRRLRRRPARRGEGPRQGARRQPARRLRPVGPERTSAPSCGTSSTRGTGPASTCASSRSNWTELDVWRYIEREGIELPELYYAHEREVFAARRHVARRRAPARSRATARRRPPAGCATAPSATCRAPARSSSDRGTVADVVDEVAASTLTERGATRADDRISEAAMEDRKKEGYF